MKSASGYYKGIKVLVVLTGMGGASTGITIGGLRGVKTASIVNIQKEKERLE